MGKNFAERREVELASDDYSFAIGRRVVGIYLLSIAVSITIDLAGCPWPTVRPDTRRRPHLIKYAEAVACNATIVIAYMDKAVRTAATRDRIQNRREVVGIILICNATPLIRTYCDNLVFDYAALTNELQSDGFSFQEISIGGKGA